MLLEKKKEKTEETLKEEETYINLAKVLTPGTWNRGTFCHLMKQLLVPAPGEHIKQHAALSSSLTHPLQRQTLAAAAWSEGEKHKPAHGRVDKSWLQLFLYFTTGFTVPL